MSDLTIISFLVFITTISNCDCQTIPIRNVNMSSNAYIKYTVVEFYAHCNPLLEKCNTNQTIKSYIKICSIKPSSNDKLIQNYKQKLEDFVNDISGNNCGTYDNASLFGLIDSEKSFECGNTFYKQSNFDNAQATKFEKTDMISATEWNGEILIVAIIASIIEGCVESTMLYNLEAKLIDTFSNKSKNPPLKLFLESSSNASAFTSSTIGLNSSNDNETTLNPVHVTPKRLFTRVKEPKTLEKGHITTMNPVHLTPKHLVTRNKELNTLENEIKTTNQYTTSVSTQNVIQLKADYVSLFEKSLLNQNTPNRLYFLVEAHCPQDYFRKGCWLHCNDIPNRRKCDANGSETCSLGWTKSKEIYVDARMAAEGNVTVETCNYINSCKDTSCNGRCITTGNNTHMCTNDIVEFDPPNLVVSIGDTIKCYPDGAGSNATSDMYTVWEIIETNGSINNAFSNFAVNGENLVVLPLATYSYNNIVVCLLKDSSHVTKAKVMRNYTVIKYPSEIQINSSLQHVYLGDYIQCKTDVWPSESFKYNFEMPNNSFTTFSINRKGDIIYIKKTATLGELILKCSVSLFDGNETVAVYYRLFKTYIYAMREFRWSYTKKKWFNYNDSFYVIANVGVEYDLQILQLTGPTVINTISGNQVRFNEMCKGGTYTFIASLYIYVLGRFISFHQTTEETLFEEPNNISFSRIIGYPDEKIFCKVNGHPQELIDVELILKDWKNRILMIRTSNFIRLPSYLQLHKVYTLICGYTMGVYNKTDLESLVTTIVIGVRPKPYKLVNYQHCLIKAIAFILLLYLFSMSLLTFFVLCNIQFWFQGQFFNHVFKTFCLYNRFRKNIRYDQKMKHISEIILEIQKKSLPGEKLKLSTLFKYLKNKYRQSFTPGYATVSSEFVPPKRSEVQSQDTMVEFKPISTYYGLGPSSRSKIKSFS